MSDSRWEGNSYPSIFISSGFSALWASSRSFGVMPETRSVSCPYRIMTSTSDDGFPCNFWWIPAFALFELSFQSTSGTVTDLRYRLSRVKHQGFHSTHDSRTAGFQIICVPYTPKVYKWGVVPCLFWIIDSCFNRLVVTVVSVTGNKIETLTIIMFPQSRIPISTHAMQPVEWISNGSRMATTLSTLCICIWTSVRSARKFNSRQSASACLPHGTFANSPVRSLW